MATSRKKPALASLREAQSQLGQIAQEVTGILTQPDPQELDQLAPRPAQVNLAQKSFTLWSLAFDMAIEELQKLRNGDMLRNEDGSLMTDSQGRPVMASLFRASDIFRCGTMSKDVAAIFTQLLKNRADEEIARDRIDLQRDLVKAIAGREELAAQLVGKAKAIDV